MKGRIDQHVVEATKVLRQKFNDLDSVGKKNVDVQARIKVRWVLPAGVRAFIYYAPIGLGQYRLDLTALYLCLLLVNGR